ncbi:MAG TPA: hypothetical protein VGO58_05765 [Chitinophagaceae bacterium]|jgi:hypothetical protein|nr:hypothetical protein [Chitinophagaceae bacterium]
MSNQNRSHLWQKWHIAFQIAPWIIVIGIVKYFVNRYDYDVFELNALFTSLVAGTIFLIGFLISGVLTDYKESEKLPSEMAGTIKNLFDDTYTIFKAKNSATARQFLDYQRTLLDSISDWFYKKEKTAVILNKISGMNGFFAELDKEGIQPNYLIKMKNEQNGMRKILLRVDTIRDTNFVGSAYAIVEAMAVLITFGLIMIRIEPFYASLFITVLVNFLIFYMILLIKDLDNPFDYSGKGERDTEISLKPVHDLVTELKEFRLVEEG